MEVSSILLHAYKLLQLWYYICLVQKGPVLKWDFTVQSYSDYK